MRSPLFLFAIACLISTTATPSSADPAAHPGAVWMLESGGVAKIRTLTAGVEFELTDTAESEAVSIDAESGNVWIYGEQRLRALRADGELLADYAVPSVSDGDVFHLPWIRPTARYGYLSTSSCIASTWQATCSRSFHLLTISMQCHSTLHAPACGWVNRHAYSR